MAGVLETAWQPGRSTHGGHAEFKVAVYRRLGGIRGGTGVRTVGVRGKVRNWFQKKNQFFPIVFQKKTIVPIIAPSNNQFFPIVLQKITDCSDYCPFKWVISHSVFFFHLWIFHFPTKFLLHIKNSLGFSVMMSSLLIIMPSLMTSPR